MQGPAKMSASSRGEIAGGDSRNPMSEADLIDKLMKRTVGVIGAEQAQRTVSMVMEMDNLESLGA